MVDELRKNFRDVGAAIDGLLAQRASAAAESGSPIANASVFPRGRLLRCGRVDFCTLEELGSPRSIINLRIDADEFPAGYLEAGGCVALHCAAEDKVEKYDTSQHCVRLWIVSVLKHFECADALPALVHCKHGRDRTGIIVAALLAICDVPTALIRSEYMLSEGSRADLFELTLAGFGLVAKPAIAGPGPSQKSRRGDQFTPPAHSSDAMRTYLRGLVDVDKIRQTLLHNPDGSM
uniref:Tyrosine specific protein phosphatases domain-containing protein n=1 Tax=Neobodo designis TaxID=312471 RepID=A0A7S1QTK0_NEODS